MARPWPSLTRSRRMRTLSISGIGPGNSASRLWKSRWEEIQRGSSEKSLRRRECELFFCMTCLTSELVLEDLDFLFNQPGDPVPGDVYLAHIHPECRRDF